MRHMDDETRPDDIIKLPPYRLTQLEWDQQPRGHNEPVADLEALVIHHPEKNSAAEIRHGVVVDGERGRKHAVIGGEMEEIEIPRVSHTFNLKPDQVLLKKDFMLEDSRISPGGLGVRNVDVPSPVGGYVGRVDVKGGLIDIYDHRDGEVIARIRHLHPIQVREGDTVQYGQALGTQNKQGLGPGAGKHVHLEIDTRYYQQYKNYIADLSSGRLSIDAGRRTQGIEPLPVFDDGTFRLGETSPRIRDLQHVLIDQNYRGAHGQPIETDGIYRLGMQPAVLAFQQAHGLPMTGDIDSATLQRAPPPMRREVDRPDHDMGREHGFGAPPSRDRRNPLDPDHPDHALYESAREKTRSLHAQHGITLPDDELARFAASVTLDARRNGMTRVDHLLFSENRKTGEVELNGNLIAIQGRLDDPANRFSATPTQHAAQTPVEESFRQLEVVERQQSQRLAQFQEQQQQLSQSPSGPRMTL
jgi:hypothetical protein